jgi:hypothetical protein
MVSRDMEWSGTPPSSFRTRDFMMKGLPSTYARRMRLSTYAIAAAVALTVAALIAMSLQSQPSGVIDANNHINPAQATSTR